ncbi:uncharacterized protein TNIN_445091 [Trichonephila inaurata madagascariensis]|uniref:Gustatory receptor n=1 Tax=Trichonephila inaurata madagascariensis TaxID=2747483 RepID=A0A8X6XX99_9ARAC|nr:uncharacterized protein TNIN_445091 [Trichonephila inaurata madagascariensis]
MLDLTDETGIQRIFKPILNLFLYCGIDLNDSNRKCPVITFSVFFHIMCLGIVVFKIVCLSFSFEWSILVTICVKLTALVLWWSVRWRRKDIRKMLEKLEPLQEELDNCDYKKLLRASRAAAVCIVLCVFLQPLVLALRYFVNQGEGLTCVILTITSDLNFEGVISVLLHEFASIYVNSSITYTVALFYSFYCCVFAVCLKEKERLLSQTIGIYQQALKIFKGIETVLSALIFIAFGHFLVSLFKDMIVLVNVVKNKRGTMLISYGLDFVANFVLTTIVVLSAESVQRRADSVRQLCHEESNISRISFVRLFEDRERLKLTGWGTFTIKKPLLLTLVAWLISYGVIILQFSSL